MGAIDLAEFMARGRLVLDKRDVEIAPAVARAIEATAGAVLLRGQRLSIDVAHAGLLVHADEGRLTQIFEHVIMSLAKHSVARSMLAIGARCEGESITVSFAASRMTVDASVETMGFTLVKQLCEVHGGRLHVTKATVLVTFPRAANAI